MLRIFLTSAAALCLAAPAFAQYARPVPYPIMPPPLFEQAMFLGTRSETGEPGAGYWTNRADYNIAATLSPSSNMLRGTEEVVYYNNSPDTLRSIVVNLYQNLHSPGVRRTESVQVTGGMSVSRVTLNGKDLVEHQYNPFAWPRQRQPSEGYRITGTKLTLSMFDGVAPGSSVTLGFSWSFEVPKQGGAPRMGQDGEVWYIAYWYPQIAVYDDVYGWDLDPYAGEGEFYMGYGDYDVSLTVPEGWLIGATGVLQNPGEVLTESVRERLAEAARVHEVVHVVTVDERKPGASTVDSRSGTLTWKFKAENVRDFAFGTSDKYLWDAAHAAVGDLDGDGATDETMIHALYRPGAITWDRAAEFSVFSIEYLSKSLWPYPYPQMTAVQGIIRGGMEFPMITLIGGNRDAERLMSVTIHELAHMWFPMIVGQDEKKYTWMDEGTATFNENDGEEAYWKKSLWPPEQQTYRMLVRSGLEESSMVHADSYRNGFARNIASYAKPGIALHALRGIVGNDRFYEALREYGRRWAYKHPTPWDMFNTFEDVLEMELDWFFRTWMYETWPLDQAVAWVERDEDGSVVVSVADLGLAPMPVTVRVTYDDGSTENQVLPVDFWLEGDTVGTLTFRAGTPQKVEIDPDGYFPDIDESNDVWERPAATTRGSK